jgi:hypothetical protein
MGDSILFLCSLQQRPQLLQQTYKSSILSDTLSASAVGCVANISDHKASWPHSLELFSPNRRQEEKQIIIMSLVVF